MSLKDLMESDISRVFLNLNGIAEKIDYNGAEITAIPEIGESNRKGNTFSTEGQSDQAWFSVAETDIPEPLSGDTITYKNKSWQVIRISETGAGLHRLECIAGGSAVMLR